MMKRFALNAMGDSMKIYVLLESCCNHFQSVFSEKEYQDFKWEYPEEAGDYEWRAYEMKDGELYFVEFIRGNKEKPE